MCQIYILYASDSGKTYDADPFCFVVSGYGFSFTVFIWAKLELLAVLSCTCWRRRIKWIWRFSLPGYSRVWLWRTCRYYISVWKPLVYIPWQKPIGRVSLSWGYMHRQTSEDLKKWEFQVNSCLSFYLILSDIARWNFCTA